MPLPRPRVLFALGLLAVAATAVTIPFCRRERQPFADWTPEHFCREVGGAFESNGALIKRQGDGRSWEELAQRSRHPKDMAGFVEVQQVGQVSPRPKVVQIYDGRPVMVHVGRLVLRGDPDLIRELLSDLDL